MGRARVLGEVRVRRSVSDSVICSGWCGVGGVERGCMETARVPVLCMLSLAL